MMNKRTPRDNTYMMDDLVFSKVMSKLTVASSVTLLTSAAWPSTVKFYLAYYGLLNA